MTRESSRRGGCPPRPSQIRTCGFPASGSSSGRFAPGAFRRRFRPLLSAGSQRGCLASVAIRRPCVDMHSGCRVPGVFPCDGPTMTLSPSLPWVLPGGVSQVPRYYKTLRLPRTPTQRLMDSPLGSSPSPRLRSARYEDASCRLAPGLTVRRRETVVLGWEYGDLTGSWDAPPVPMPCSLTPVGPRHPTNSVLRCGPRTQYDEGSNGLTISGLHHTASAPAVYASQPHRCGPRKTRLRRVVSPYREGVEPSGHHKRFPLMSYS